MRAVCAGEAVFGPGVAARVLRQLTAPATPATRPFAALTEREFEVLELLASGHAARTIASQIGIAPKTVSNLVSSILGKLHLVDRAQAAIVGRDAGLGEQR